MSGFSYLRLMVEEDIAWVLSVEQRAYDFPWTREGFENSFEQGLNYVFYSEQGQKLGYCCMLLVLDEIQVLNMCVAPEFQGQGIAKAALSDLLEKLQKTACQIIFLEVRASNEPAKRLYASFNFTENGVRKGYYRSSIWDGVLMELVEQREDAILMSFSWTH